MRTNAQIISTLLQYYLWDNPAVLKVDKLENISAEQWLEVHKLALKQGVCAIVLDAILAAEIAIPRPIKMRFIASTDNIERKYKDKVKAAVKLREIYSENDINLMILKGIGLAQAYPIPKHRPCSDLDIWLFGKQIEADKILQEKYKIPISEAQHHHTVFYIDGVMIENHYDFIEQHSRSSKQNIEVLLKELSENEQPYTVNIADKEFYIPSPNLNAFFLIMHAGAHFAAENISIRHLVDWALFLKKYGQKIEWSKLLKIADQFGFRSFLCCLNSMCISFLGMPKELAPCTENSEKIVQKAVKDVLDYRQKEIPNNFIKGWIFRIKRRFANSWKQKMVYKDSQITAFIRSILVHIIRPNVWRKKKA